MRNKLTKKEQRKLALNWIYGAINGADEAQGIISQVAPHATEIIDKTLQQLRDRLGEDFNVSWASDIIQRSE